MAFYILVNEHNKQVVDEIEIDRDAIYPAQDAKDHFDRTHPGRRAMGYRVYLKLGSE